MEERKDFPKRIKLLVTIVDRGKGEKVVNICKKQGCMFHMIYLGYGTANSDLLDFLGLGNTAKDIVLSVVLEEKTQQTLQALTKEMKFDKPGNGIAFTISINSVGGPKTLRYISGLFLKKG